MAWRFFFFFFFKKKKTPLGFSGTKDMFWDHARVSTLAGHDPPIGGPQHESSHPYVNDLLLPPRPASATTQAVDHRGEVQRRSGWAGASCVRGGLLAKGPDTSLGEVHRGSCSEGIHMEEKKVEVKVQEEEVEDRERRKGDQSEGRRENKQPLRRMTHGKWKMDSHGGLEVTIRQTEWKKKTTQQLRGTRG